MNIFKNHFLFAFLVLLVGCTVTTVIAAISNSIDRGFWPIGLLVSTAVALVYSLTYSVLAHLMRLSVFPAGYVHILVAKITIIMTILFYYVPVDWSAINNGTNMTSLQAVVHSDIVYYAVYLVGIITALVVGLINKLVMRR